MLTLPDFGDDASYPKRWIRKGINAIRQIFVNGVWHDEKRKVPVVLPQSGEALSNLEAMKPNKHLEAECIRRINTQT